MNLVKYYLEKNKILTCLMLILITSLVCLTAVNYRTVQVKLYHIGNSLNSTIGSITMLLLCLLGIVTIFLMVLILIVNTIGNRRADLIKYYGKNKFLQYLIILSLLTLIISVLLFSMLVTYNMWYRYVVQNYMYFYDTTHNMIKDIFMLYGNLGIIILGIFYACLEIKELVLNSRVKYMTKKSKALKIFLKICKNIFLAIYIVIVVIAYFNMMADNSTTYIYNNLFMTLSINQYIMSSLFIITLIIVIINYCKTFKDEIFL